MRKIYSLVLSVIFVTAVSAQTHENFAVQISAEVSKSAGTATLSWPKDANATGYQLYKRLGMTPWGLVANLGVNDTSYTDNIPTGTPYEYMVRKTLNNAANTPGYGYMYAGIEKLPWHGRGRVILLVDNDLKDALANEISRLEADMQADGWVVIRRDIDRTASVTDVKQEIKNIYDQNTSTTNVLFLLGHIPVPYSGGDPPYAIDGHTDHYGAWPADAYYADMNGTWTDQNVNLTEVYVDNNSDGTPDDTVKVRTANANIPGDGKFDQGYLPSDLELQVGRVDFYNMPAFTETEVELMRRYLNKDHLWRTGQISVRQKAIVQDKFGIVNYGQGFFESFSSSAYKNFAPMVGTGNVETGIFLADTKANSYLWAYGAGPGSDANAANIIGTTHYTTDSIQTVFTMLFGSYFGDWNTKNNLLRAALANKGPTLTSAWSGRPHWTFHHMALGMNIGFSQQLTLNNFSDYFRSILFNQSQRPVSSALMGDPTLRMHNIMPPSGLTVSTPDQQVVDLSWTASSDPNILGYEIFRGKSINATVYTRVTSTPVTGTSYTDQSPHDGMNVYVVKAVRLEETPSGTYYNTSQGSFDSIAMIVVGVASAKTQETLSLYPNPNTGVFFVDMPEQLRTANLNITDALGRSVFSLNGTTSSQIRIDLEGLANGIYNVRLSGNGLQWHRQIVKQ